MYRKDLKLVEGQAVVANGVLSIALPFAAALTWGYAWATFAFIVVAAATYLFQTYVFALPEDWTDEDAFAVRIGSLCIWVLWFIAMLLLLGGY